MSLYICSFSTINVSILVLVDAALRHHSRNLRDRGRMLRVSILVLVDAALRQGLCRQ